jgi:transposase
MFGHRHEKGYKDNLWRKNMARKKQRQFTAEFKLDTVMEVLRGEKPIAQICRERDITDSLVYKWRQEFLEKAPGIFEGKQAPSQHNEQAERIAELERLVGQLTMENALLKKGSSFLETYRRKNGL